MLDALKAITKLIIKIVNWYKERRLLIHLNKEKSKIKEKSQSNDGS